jgi:hypothetical protein
VVSKGEQRRRRWPWLTEYPVETGWAPTADLYWSPKSIVCAASYEFTGGGAGGRGTVVEEPRCNRARELVLAKPANFDSDAFPVFDSTGALTGNVVSIQYTSFGGVPRSKYDNDRHYMHQVCSGNFSIGSSVDGFTSLGGGDPANFIGYCEVVANPGKQSVFTFPLYRSGPSHLIASLSVQIFRQPWGSSEL